MTKCVATSRLRSRPAPADHRRGNATFAVPADAAGEPAISHPPDQEESTWISVYLGR